MNTMNASCPWPSARRFVRRVMAPAGLLVFVAGAPLAQTLSAATAVSQDIDGQIVRHYVGVEALYKDIHANPELAFAEVNTAKKLAKQLRDLGFQVTEGVGKTGVVGILHNGSGPTIMVRTEL